MTCEICGEIMFPDEPWTSVDITVHPKCADALENMVENRKKQKEKIDEIILELKNLESIHDLVVVDLIEKLEKFKEEEL